VERSPRPRSPGTQPSRSCSPRAPSRSTSRPSSGRSCSTCSPSPMSAGASRSPPRPDAPGARNSPFARPRRRREAAARTADRTAWPTRLGWGCDVFLTLDNRGRWIIGDGNVEFMKKSELGFPAFFGAQVFSAGVCGSRWRAYRPCRALHADRRRYPFSCLLLFSSMGSRGSGVSSPQSTPATAGCCTPARSTTARTSPCACRAPRTDRGCATS